MPLHWLYKRKDLTISNQECQLAYLVNDVFVVEINSMRNNAMMIERESNCDLLVNFLDGFHAVEVIHEWIIVCQHSISEDSSLSWDFIANVFSVNLWSISHC